MAYANAISRYRHQRGTHKKGKPVVKGNESRKGDKSRYFSCQRCTKAHKQQEQCPAHDSICSVCNKRGHWAKKCWSANWDGTRSSSARPNKHGALGCLLAQVKEMSAPTVDVAVVARWPMEQSW